MMCAHLCRKLRPRCICLNQTQNRSILWLDQCHCLLTLNSDSFRLSCVLHVHGCFCAEAMTINCSLHDTKLNIIILYVNNSKVSIKLCPVVAVHHGNSFHVLKQIHIMNWMNTCYWWWNVCDVDNVMYMIIIIWICY